MAGSSSSPALPAEFTSADEAIRAALTAAGAAGDWNAASRVAVLAWAERAANVLAVIRSTVLTAERDAGTWALTSERSLADFAGRVSRHGRGGGYSAVGQAATLAQMPRLADAMVDGAVTSRHVQEITRATAGSPRLASSLATPEGQAELVSTASRMDAREFGKALRHLAATLDPAARQRDHDAQRASRFLNVTHTAAGTQIRGLLDNVTGHEFAKAIEAHNPRPAAGDDRSPEQRRADALGSVVRAVLTDPRTTPSAVAPVQAVVTFSQETWAALRAARVSDEAAGAVTAAGQDAARAAQTTRTAAGTASTESTESTESTAGMAIGAAAGNVNRRPRTGSTSDVADRLRGVTPVVDENGAAWPASEVARALCHCTLTRAVVDAGGLVLDLGHVDRYRLFNRSHWLALLAAGRTTCAVDGCSMPLRYCELHHIRWWERGGGTDLSNLAPECSYHHHQVHDLDLIITRRADGSFEHRYPDSRLYGGATPDDRSHPS